MSSGWFVQLCFQIITLNRMSSVHGWKSLHVGMIHPYVCNRFECWTCGWQCMLRTTGTSAQQAEDKVAQMEDAQDVLEESRANALAMDGLSRKTQALAVLQGVAEQKGA